MTVYHVEFGQMRHIGRFAADQPGLPRGQKVVIESRRGVELGRVVTEALSAGDETHHPKILRSATEVDLDRATEAEATRNVRFDACRKVFDEGIWPIEPIDVEPLLDGDRAVLYYFGPHQLNVTGLSESLREACGLYLVFEPVGKDIPFDVEVAELQGDRHSCGDCGSSTDGCGSSGGGCGTGSDSHGGCSSCGISELVSRRKRPAGHVS